MAPKNRTKKIKARRKKLTPYEIKKREFIDFWNTNPSEKKFCAWISGEVMQSYHLYYMIKYPNGGVPKNG